LNSTEITQKFSNHPPRYSEAALVKKLEELGIGRPSTYAPTIGTIQKRGYVVKEDREGTVREYKVLSLTGGEVVAELKTENTGAERNKMFPTDIGIVVTDFLEENFKSIMDYHFTASVEEEFDHISRGELEWTNMLHKFYEPFHKKVEDTLENSERASGERALGTDPKSGRPVIARLGRYGPMVQIGSTEEGEEKPKFAKLRTGQSIQTIELDEAMELFKLPRTVGQFEEKDVVASVGRFGPFLRYDGAFYNIGKLDPLEINLEDSIQVIKDKQEAARKALLHDFENDPPVKVIQGRYGPYMTLGKDNYKLPKDIDIDSLTLEKCLEIAENSQPTNKGGKRKTTKAAPKTKAKAKPKAKPKAKK
jgi:DNA topoisomerase-1